MFTYPKQQPYLIQMPPKTNRRVSSVSANNSMFRMINGEPTQTPTHLPPQTPRQPPVQPKEIGVLTGQPNPAVNGVKPMKWGEPTWFLFHTLAEKVKEEEFSQFRMELLKTIYLICSALPCPECAKHASDYMNGINFNTIITKEDLKLMLFTFHNTVNARKNFPMFSMEELNSKYASSNTVKIIQNFMINFSPLRNKTYTLDVSKHYRQMVSTQLVGWFNDNIQKFHI